ncbi:MAG: hypothetical protein AB7E95_06535 [Kiritimatiellales bacterium]
MEYAASLKTKGRSSRFSHKVWTQMKMTKKHQTLVLISSIIVFLFAWFTCREDPSEAIAFFAMSIILYQAASHIGITLQINEVKRTISTSRQSDDDLDKKTESNQKVELTENPGGDF